MGLSTVHDLTMIALFASDLTIPEGYATVLIGALLAGFITFIGYSFKWFVKQAEINQRHALLLDQLERRIEAYERRS